MAIVGVFKLLLGGPGENTRLEIFHFYMTTSQLMMIALLLLLPFAVHRAAPIPAVRLAACAALIPVGISLYATVTRGAYLAAAAGIVLIACVRNWKILIPLAVLVAGAPLLLLPTSRAGCRALSTSITRKTRPGSSSGAPG